MKEEPNLGTIRIPVSAAKDIGWHQMSAPTATMAAAPPVGLMDHYFHKYRHFVCGWGAAFVNITMTFPLNKLMFRQQLHGYSIKKALLQLQSEGLLSLYRGLLPPLLQKTTSLSIMFGSYQEYQNILGRNVPQMPVPINHGAAALLAGTTEALLTPFERVQVLLQDKHYHNRFKNTLHAFRELRPYGIREYYRGATPILMRNGPSNVMFFMLRERLKDSLPINDRNPSLDTLGDFISGGLLGAVISTLFFPVNVVKTQMQSRLGGEYLSVWTAFKLVHTDRGGNWNKIFRGVHINFTRSVISWGIINATYELLMKHFFGS